MAYPVVSILTPIEMHFWELIFLFKNLAILLEICIEKSMRVVYQLDNFKIFFWKNHSFSFKYPKTIKQIHLSLEINY